MEKTVTQAIRNRRSTRVYLDTPLDDEKVKQCLQNAALAPSSSNLQLWEFYHITDKNTISKIAAACFNQNAAKTAQQIVVIATRKDLWKQRVKSNINFIEGNLDQSTIGERWKTRKKMALKYYKQTVPSIYTDVFGILGFVKYCSMQIIGLFRPVYRQMRLKDMQTVAHKSTALAAQNFMNSMSAIGYDTCPMEGSDTLRIKRILNLPRGAKINMVIGCGLRDTEKGIYGPRFRVPFEEVYFKR